MTALKALDRLQADVDADRLKSSETSTTANFNARQRSSGLLKAHVPRRRVRKDLRQKADKRLDVWIATPAFRPICTDVAAIDGKLFQGHRKLN